MLRASGETWGVREKTSHNPEGVECRCAKNQPLWGWVGALVFPPPGFTWGYSHSTPIGVVAPGFTWGLLVKLFI